MWSNGSRLAGHQVQREDWAAVGRPEPRSPLSGLLLAYHCPRGPVWIRGSKLGVGLFVARRLKEPPPILGEAVRDIVHKRLGAS